MRNRRNANARAICSELAVSLAVLSFVSCHLLISIVHTTRHREYKSTCPRKSSGRDNASAYKLAGGAPPSQALLQRIGPETRTYRLVSGFSRTGTISCPGSTA